MNLLEIYENNRSSIIGSDIDDIEKFQKKLIENYILDKKKLSQNDSTKHIDQKIINQIEYFIDQQKSEIEYQKDFSNTSSITVKNGNIFSVNNLDEKKILLQPLHFDKKLVFEKIDKYKTTFVNDYIANLNSIFFNSGFDFNLQDDSNARIELFNINDVKQNTIYAKNFFRVGKGSKLILIEYFANKIHSNSNIINYFELEAGSELIHLVIQNNEKNANLQFSSHTNSQPSSLMKQFIFNISNSSIRNHHYGNLKGMNAKINLQGLFFASNNQIIDNKTLIQHLEPNCTSNQTYKGILSDNSKASYLSKTYVDQIAQQTEGYQLSKGLILSNNAYFHSKPELRIFADDVKCSHGSTIGPFEEDMLFYLRTRGLNLFEAKSFLIKSFCADIMENIDDKEYITTINQLIENWLNKNKF